MKSIWKFGSRELRYAVVGVILYGIFSWIPNIIQFPITGNDAFKPGIVIPIFFGIIFGPWVGFITGLTGNILGDLLSGYSFWIFQDFGFGLIGFVAGFCKAKLINYRQKKEIIIIEIFVLISVAIGMLFVSITEIWASSLNFFTSIKIIFLPGFLRNGLTGLILTPLMLVGYYALGKRLGDKLNIE